MNTSTTSFAAAAVLALLTSVNIHAGNAMNAAFVTSVAGNGDLSTWPDADAMTGLEAGDRICAARADAAGLAGDYVAYLSNAVEDAYCRIHGLAGKRSDNCGLAELPAPEDSNPWLRVDGRPLFPNAAQAHFPDDIMYYPMWLDEFGDQHAASILTGSNSHGSTGGGVSNCSNYSSTAGGGSYGVTTATSANWGSGFGAPCTISARLACFRVDTQPLELSPGSQGVRKAFVGPERLFGAFHLEPMADGMDGVAGGDRICRNLAADAGLRDADTYKAFLSDDTAAAADRFNWPDMGWARLDGYLFAEDMMSLTSEGSLTALNLTTDGQYLGREVVWSGTAPDGTPNGNNCGNWSDPAATGSATSINRAGSGWGTTSSSGGWNCGGDFPIARLFCLSDSDLIFHDGGEA